jgi:hypothetical protein
VLSTQPCLALNASVVQEELKVFITVGIVGVQLKSQYLPLVATIHKLGVHNKSLY